MIKMAGHCLSAFFVSENELCYNENRLKQNENMKGNVL